MLRNIDGAKFFREVFRFLIVGFLNLGVTYAAYRLCLIFVPYAAAYTLATMTGMLFSWLVNSLYSFGVRPKARRILPHMVIATIFYLAGLGLMTVFIESWSVPEKFAPLLVIAVLTPASFFATRAVLVWEPGTRASKN
ncbi:MAG: GtrA family protein [Rhodospirillaceae bacterium]|jgi:putative flippase GtrA|nr:GtrA family protein [Rhodospirillaceae bacterium]MBT4489631.1 GtrA family protein [Rhodospirillaceae bacterium]MBT5192675.1 GtrA family protein [Rhodospirillaceae bacterium]MBT5896470.1 GtrA family protein [Rhodospirillaceae bacterium]MBT6430711.1 GtrA family protein [Rhodospirillaceae bacterium]